MQENLTEFFNRYTIKGFLDHEEGLALYRYVLSLKALGVCLEIGSYCGKSSVYLGQACKETGNTLFAVDHHRGSEEHQPGEEYHDKSLFDKQYNNLNSLPEFRRTLQLADIESNVVPIVTSSQVLEKNWAMPLSFVFVDGGHSEKQAMHDVLAWSRHIVARGIMGIHDVFEHPDDGGQAPWRAMQALLDEGRWRQVEKVKSLVFLQKLP